MRILLPVQGCQRFSARRRNLQRPLGKWPIPLALGLALALSSCVAPPAEQPGPGHDRSARGWTGNESSAYRRGHSDGSHAKRDGRPYEPAPARVSAPLREEYLRGYKDGYRNANDNPWSEHRAYELGQSYGHRDRIAGSAMNPDGRVGEVPHAVRDEFRRGYRDGWQSTAPRPPVRPPRTVSY